jgi:hypothetical protein
MFVLRLFVVWFVCLPIDDHMVKILLFIYICLFLPAILSPWQAQLDFVVTHTCPAEIRVCVISIECFLGGTFWSGTTFQQHVQSCRTVQTCTQTLNCGASLVVSVQSRVVGLALG